ncbi:hypothetical protein PMKS-004048 [Pichia membranifaciens]|uniref:WIF domain-containing protein n=1 Tax=Pichia membranifaciens TaxID=4926 RepID=A0A1Q2YLW3_9ASCO|nr:hypothetical protein PMKS-004048 [Pichia membranifaciens]
MPKADSEVSTDEPEEWDEAKDSEEIDEDDPLFGKVEHNKELKLLLSPKSSKSAQRKGKRKKELIDTRNSKRVSNGLDILQQLQVHMKDPLDKELGFSLNTGRKLSSINSSNSKDFMHLMEEVKREREIKEFLSDQEKTELKDKDINDKILQWIRSNVFSKFLDIENSGNKVHGNWILQLRKALKAIVVQNNGEFDVDVVNSKIIENPQYSTFKCFTSQGVKASHWRGISFLFDEYSVQSMIESLDVKYVEGFTGLEDGIIVNEAYDDLESILKALGFDDKLTLSEVKPIRKLFDNKNDLPRLGCGFQVYKFIKIVEAKKCADLFSERDIVQALILMSVDCNVEIDLSRFFYDNGYYTGKEIAFKKIKKLKDFLPTVNSLLSKLFLQHCPDLWFKFISGVEITNDKGAILFAGKLILRFLSDNKVNDGVEIYDSFEGVECLEELFIIFCTFVKDMSGKCFKLEDENLSELVYMKVELIKEMVIMNHEVIKKWKGSTEDNDRFKGLRSSILKVKNHFFMEYANNFNPIIPKCRRVLDFLYHELSGIEVGDFFVDESSNQSEYFGANFPQV